MALVIKKRISLEFLGEEYKDSYLVLKAMSVTDYENLGKKTVKECIIERFIDGEIQQDEEKVKITKDTLQELPGEVFVKAFAAITGQIDPKYQGLFPNQSTTDNQPQTN